MKKIDASRILSHKFFIEHPKEFYKFYKENLIKDNIIPNIGHQMLSVLEEKNIAKAIITHNIDGLHKSQEVKML